MLPALEHLLDDNPHGDVHVVASGDPMLHGIGTSLVRLHGAHRVRVLPHVLVGDAGLRPAGLGRGTIEVISLVTASVHTAVRRGGRPWCCPATPPHPPNWPGCSPRPPRRFGVHRSRAARRAHRTDPQPGGRRLGRRAPADVDDLNVVAVALPARRPGLPDPARRRLPARWPDHQADRSRGTLAALAPRPGQLLWDVGSGSAASLSNGAAPTPVAAPSHSRPAHSVASESRPTAAPSASRWTSAVRRPRTSTARHPGCDIHRRRADPTRPGVRLYRPAGTGRTAGGINAVTGNQKPCWWNGTPARRRTAPLPALPR